MIGVDLGAGRWRALVDDLDVLNRDTAGVSRHHTHGSAAGVGLVVVDAAVFEDDVVVIEDDRWAAVDIDVEVSDHLAVVVRDDGAVVADKGSVRCHSFLVQLLVWICQ